MLIGYVVTLVTSEIASFEEFSISNWLQKFFEVIGTDYELFVSCTSFGNSYQSHPLLNPIITITHPLSSTCAIVLMHSCHCF